MIAHFIKWDFSLLKGQWGLLALATVVGGIVAYSGHSAGSFFVLSYLYFLFAAMASNTTTGTVFRTQHTMSRNYMLSLPVSRTKMYNAILVRCLVLYLPLIVLVIAGPLMTLAIKLPLNDVIGAFTKNPGIVRLVSLSVTQLALLYFLYFTFIAIAFFWYLNATIGMQINFERVSSYLTSRQRAFLAISTSVLFLVELGLVAWLPLFLVTWGLKYFIAGLVNSLALALLKYRVAREKWFGGTNTKR